MGMASPRGPGSRTRPYHSERRSRQARETRARVLRAATDRFLEVGYAATTIRAVASASGVSVPTVELLFRTKAQLLKDAIDVAIAGDGAPIPMLEREWAASAQQAADAVTFIAIFAHALKDAATRSAGLIAA